ncbi:MAG: hypothetical protein QM781_05870 [Chitinophagaceae bacterium]
MKLFLLLMLATALAGQPCAAQCDKGFVLTASLVEYLDASYQVTRTMDDNSSIRISRDSVTISPEHDPALTGVVTQFTCNWQTPWIDGKSVIKAVFNDRGVETPLTLILEAKNGHLSLLILFDNKPERIIRIWPTVKK